MALEALSATQLLNFVIYDTISAPPSLETHDFSPETALKQPPLEGGGVSDSGSSMMSPEALTEKRQSAGAGTAGEAAQGRKKRKRRVKVCKNKEEAETQRMTHITVERNRRKQMNEHLAVLRSLMPESYVQRGDQASIVGGAIEYVKELEHLLQSLEARKLLLPQEGRTILATTTTTTAATATTAASAAGGELLSAPFAQFFSYPQYTWSQIPNKYTSKSKATVADIEVTLIETHANVRILSRRTPRQLSKIVASFHTLYLSILHLSITTLNPLVLYSISVKVEEGCQLTSADEIAGAVHHMVRIIEEEEILC